VTVELYVCVIIGRCHRARARNNFLRASDGAYIGCCRWGREETCSLRMDGGPQLRVAMITYIQTRFFSRLPRKPYARSRKAGDDTSDVTTCSESQHGRSDSSPEPSSPSCSAFLRCFLCAKSQRNAGNCNSGDIGDSRCVGLRSLLPITAVTSPDITITSIRSSTRAFQYDGGLWSSTVIYTSISNCSEHSR